MKLVREHITESIKHLTTTILTLLVLPVIYAALRAHGKHSKGLI